ncbi:hypothetical protein FMEAI12_5580006 [Parafrankia sp. Ea1.12]|nr:hypothetical protein FMEAI12_5580006 [Parafrankia sp. Ea1.12]
MPMTTGRIRVQFPPSRFSPGHRITKYALTPVPVSIDDHVPAAERPEPTAAGHGGELTCRALQGKSRPVG